MSTSSNNDSYKYIDIITLLYRLFRFNSFSQNCVSKRLLQFFFLNYFRINKTNLLALKKIIMLLADVNIRLILQFHWQLYLWSSFLVQDSFLNFSSLTNIVIPHKELQLQYLISFHRFNFFSIHHCTFTAFSPGKNITGYWHLFTNIKH